MGMPLGQRFGLHRTGLTEQEVQGSWGFLVNFHMAVGRIEEGFLEEAGQWPGVSQVQRKRRAQEASQAQAAATGAKASVVGGAGHRKGRARSPAGVCRHLLYRVQRICLYSLLSPWEAIAAVHLGHSRPSRVPIRADPTAGVGVGQRPLPEGRAGSWVCDMCTVTGTRSSCRESPSPPGLASPRGKPRPWWWWWGGHSRLPLSSRLKN